VTEKAHDRGKGGRRRLLVLLVAMAALGGCNFAESPSRTPSRAPTGVPPTPAPPIPTPETTPIGPASPWSQAPDQAALDGLGLASVVWTGTRFVAISGLVDATVLDSADGRTWHRQPAFIPTAWLVGPDRLAAGPGGLVAAGGGNGGPLAFWHSDDGLAWAAAPDQPALPARDGAFEHVNAVIASDDGWLAVGGAQYNNVPTPGLLRAIVLASADGASWTRLPDAPSLRYAEMTGVARASSGFVAVGNVVADPTRPDSGLRPAIWTSTDGRAWEREEAALSVEVPTSSPGGDRIDLEYVVGVASRTNRLVAVGGVARDGGMETALAWWPDGGTWTRVEIEAVSQVLGLTITAIPAGFLVLGDGRPGCAGGIWESLDGSAWTCVGNDPVFNGFAVNGVASSPDADVLVGQRLGDPLAGSSWVRLNH
jgi:hypothetical protein